MTESVFHRVVVPVANPSDAESTARALVPHVRDTGCTVIAVHVIEKRPTSMDKASVEQRELHAEEMFDTMAAVLNETGMPLNTDLRYTTDVSDSIIEAAHEHAASAIVFTPRGGSRWRKLLTGDVTYNLVENSDVPILVLPDETEDDERTDSESLEQTIVD